MEEVFVSCQGQLHVVQRGADGTMRPLSHPYLARETVLYLLAGGRTSGWMHSCAAFMFQVTEDTAWWDQHVLVQGIHYAALHDIALVPMRRLG